MKLYGGVDRERPQRELRSLHLLAQPSSDSSRPWTGRSAWISRPWKVHVPESTTGGLREFRATAASRSGHDPGRFPRQPGRRGHRRR